MSVFIVCASLLSCVLLTQCQNTQVINSLVDTIINKANSYMLAEGIDRITLPNVTENFLKQLIFGNVTGYFKATKGWFGDAPTVKRTGDVTVTTTSTTMVLNIQLGLDTMEAGYDYYKVFFLGIGPSGMFSFSVDENALDCQITLFFNGSVCMSTVDRASIAKFTLTKIHATGLGYFNFLLDNIAKWVITKFYSETRSLLESQLKSSIKTAMSQLDLCRSIVNLLVH